MFETTKELFEELEKINNRPKPFEFYTTEDLWTDAYTSERMLECHLNGDIDMSSRKAGFIERSAEWIAGRFIAGPGTKVADFGCGPGLYTTKLAQKGAEVTGIDFSKRSLRHARETAEREELSIRYVYQNYLDFETDERFALIQMIMCDFCVLSPGQRKHLLEKFYTLLEPGGAVLLDVYSLPGFARRKEETSYAENLLDGFWSADKYYGFLNIFKYEQEKVVLDKYTLIEASRRRTVYNWLQYFSPEGLEKEFVECGFTIEKFYGNVAGSPFDPESGEFAVVARKQ